MTAFFIDGLAALPFLLWLVAVELRRRRAQPTASLIRAALCAIAVSYLLAHLNRWLRLWPGRPDFPSGHVTFASCCWYALALLDRRFALLGLPLLGVLAYALVAAGWHGRLDVAGGFVLGSLAMAAFGGAYLRERASTESSQR